MARVYYLGPASWSQKLLRWLPFAKKFGVGKKSPAKGHDDGYAKGGTQTDKNKVDIVFLNNMTKLCGHNPFAYLFRNLYYNLVVKYGHKYFNYKNG